jgi:two-component sensor histidine kinase
VVVLLSRDDGALTVHVANDGAPLAEGFDLGSASGLGLSIVRTLVTTELAGSIAIRPASAGDVERSGLARLGENRGTFVELRVPVSVE